MVVKSIALGVLLIVVSWKTYAQDDDMSKLVNSEVSSDSKEKVTASFKTTRLINLSTVEQVKRGELDFRIAHRFLNIAGNVSSSKNSF